jgi:hypothetical protein
MPLSHHDQLNRLQVGAHHPVFVMLNVSKKINQSLVGG